MKRILAWLLCLTMCVSLLPTWALAEEPGAAPEEQILESVEMEEELLHEHVYEAAVTEPTCTEQGYTTYTCACGDSYIDDYLDALDHPERVMIPEVPATCTEAGVSAGVQCAVCGEILEGCEEIPTLTEKSEPEPESELPNEAGDGDTADIVPGESYVKESNGNTPEQVAASDYITEEVKEEESDSADVEPEKQTTDETPTTTAVSEASPELEETEIVVSEPVQESEDVAEQTFPEEETIVVRTQIIFHITPADAEVTVYSENEQGEKTEYDPESDGSYLLYPGVYCYSLNAEGYLSVENVFLVVVESQDAMEVELSMIPEAAEKTNGGSAEKQPVKEKTEEFEEKGLLILDVEGHTAKADAMSTEVASGTCGARLTWMLEENGALTISGSGAMNNYTYDNRLPPWYNYSELIKTVIINSGVTSIGDYAFRLRGFSGLTSVTIPESVTRIGRDAFDGCSGLTSVTLPFGLTSIEDSAFYGCRGLTNITIPNHVTNIGSYAFAYCSGLTSITIPSDVTSICDHTFYECYGLTNITIPSSVTSIGGHAFYGCKSLTSITIPSGVTSICDYTFYGCYGLTDITIPSSVTSIGDNTFYGCYGLTSITIPKGVTSIGYNAFNSCRGLTSVTLPESMNSIGDTAFAYCIGLTSITIPKGVTSIGYGVFMECSELKSVTLPESVTLIGNQAFACCSGLTSITIPANVASIGGGAFNGCSGLTSITMPASVTSIGDHAFCYCDELNTVYYTGSQTEWNDIEIGSYNENLVSAKLVLNYTGPTLDKPARVKVKVVKTGITVSWEAVNGAERYYVQRKTGAGEWTKMGYKTGTSFTDTSVTSGTVYSYRVRAHSDTDNVNGAYKASSAITYVKAPTISSVKNAAKGVQIKWKAVIGAEKYRIWRKAGSGKWIKLGDTTKTSYTDTKAKSGTKYSYRIKCINADGKLVNAYSATKSITFVKMPVITSLTALSGKTVLKWEKVAGATKFRVFRKGPNDSGWVKLGDTKKLAYTDKTAVAGTKYSYAVKAYNGSAKQWSVQSGAKSIKAR